MEQKTFYIPSQRKTLLSVFFISVQLAKIKMSFFSASGFDRIRNEVHSEEHPSEAEQWLLLVDQTDLSHRRAVIIKNKHSGMFLAVHNGRFTGLTSYDEDCKWFLV